MLGKRVIQKKAGNSRVRGRKDGSINLKKKIFDVKQRLLPCNKSVLSLGREMIAKFYFK
jgi:hypothetical protein